MKAHLVIPCYNESRRLPYFLPELLKAIRESGLNIDVEVVDDGSSEAERVGMFAAVEELRKRFPFLKALNSLEANSGKGGAVYSGWRNAWSTAEWLAFVDADGSVSATETCRLLKHCMCAVSPKACFGSRVQMLGRKVERLYSRHLMGRVFATMVGVFIDNEVYDSQCGLKAVPSAFFREVSPSLNETRFAFDVELLAALNQAGLPVEEFPVDWREVAGSKVHPLRDTASMLVALWRIRKHMRECRESE